jgi:hypothetical protein
VFGISSGILEKLFRDFFNVDSIATLWPEPRMMDVFLLALLR